MVKVPFYTMNVVKLYGSEHVGFLTLLLSAISLHIALIRSNNAVLPEQLPLALDMECSFLTSNARHIIKNGQQITPVPSIIILSDILKISFCFSLSCFFLLK